MPISKLSRKRYKVVDRMIINQPIRLMKIVAMDTKSSVATKTNIVSQSKRIGVKTPLTNSWAPA